MTAAILSQIQRDAFVRQKRNFGEPNGLLMIAGMLEEFGEAQDGIADTAEFLDGVSDCCIYLMQLCSICEWDIGDLWDQRALFELPSRPWPILLGRISHHYVKGRVSHYRGTQEEHDVRCRSAIAALLRHWDEHLTSMGWDFAKCARITWEKVSARDWTAERPAPGETDGPRVFEGTVDADECYLIGPQPDGSTWSEASDWMEGLYGKRVRLTVEAIDQEALCR